MKEYDIIFSILTLPEVEFLAPTAEKFIDRGNKVGFILFHEAGRARLQEKNIPFFNIHELRDVIPYTQLNDKELEELRIKFGISNFRHLFIHDKMGYNRKNEENLLQKVVHYLQVLDRIFSENNVKCVIQELGGLSPSQCVYYAARKNNIDHVFYEPSAFSKRIVFNLNSYYSSIPDRIMNSPITPETKKGAEGYLEKYLQNKSVVIPFKDKHSFADQGLRKIFNMDSAGRLKRKLMYKYILGQREEHNEIGWAVRFNFIKFFRRLLLSPYYTKPDYKSKYIYFPFHVPHDVQLTSRSRLFYFQEGFVEYMCRIIPYGYKLYIKEHPASIGGHSFSVLRKLLNQHNNLFLIHPMTNSFDLIKNAELIISVNSKVGFESIMQGKKVIVVGDAFYKNKGVTYDVSNLNELESTINHALRSNIPSKEKITEFLTRIYQWSYPCELFFMEKENLERSSESFYTYLKTEKFQKLRIV